MAVTDMRSLNPKIPKLDQIRQDQVGLDYDRRTDTLFVHLMGSSRPAISVFNDDDTIYRVDPVTEEVIGFEIEDFLARVLHALPTNIDDEP